MSKEANWAPINEVVAQYGHFPKRITVDLGKPINDVSRFVSMECSSTQTAIATVSTLSAASVNPP